VRECEELVARGTREIMLLGQIVTSYGRRDYPHTGGVTPFVQLLERVHALPGLRRLRFTSPHPRGFREDLADAYRRLPKLGEHVHLPVQSGSDRILKAMRRPYGRDRYLEIVAMLRAAQPALAFSTDLIVGFPGETEADFEATRELCRQVDYDMAYVFKYSVRTGTPAATMPDPVPEAVREARNQVLLADLRAGSLRRAQALVGTVQEVLVEGPDRTGQHLTGRTRGNRATVFPGHPRLAGELVAVEITRASVSTLYGELVPAAAAAPAAAP